MHSALWHLELGAFFSAPHMLHIQFFFRSLPPSSSESSPLAISDTIEDS